MHIMRGLVINYYNIIIEVDHFSTLCNCIIIIIIIDIIYCNIALTFMHWAPRVDSEMKYIIYS